MFSRIKHRGLSDTSKQTLFFALRFARYSNMPRLINFVCAKAAKRARQDKLTSLPYRYTIDPINVCNLRCPLCPTGLGKLERPQVKIALDEYKRLVDQIAPHAYQLELYNWGEPFLHPQIFEIIQYAHDRRLLVRLSSNLNHFSPAMAERTVAAGLDVLTVSVDGSTEESYQSYRRRGKLAAVIQNVKYLAAAKKQAHADHPLIVARMLINRHNETQVGELRQIMREAGADIFTPAPIFINTENAAQRAEWLPSDSDDAAYDYQSQDDPIRNHWHCSDLWETMVINPNGGIAPCCWLHDEKYDFANAFTQPLAEIWNSPAYVSARRTFARDGASPSQHVVCNDCRGEPYYNI